MRHGKTSCALRRCRNLPRRRWTSWVRRVAWPMWTKALCAKTICASAAPGEEIVRPVYLPGYVAWEHRCGHHDQLSDVFSLGSILASLACGLDLTDPEDLELLVRNRDNLFALNPHLHPVIAGMILQMTELNRHRRPQTLETVAQRLRSYRDQAADYAVDYTRLKGFRESTPTGRSKILLAHLRNRLFEISRRNRLVYFKPTLQTLNLTLASVPLMLDHRNIKATQLFLWHDQIAKALSNGESIVLGQYVRFEDAPYASGVLDQIIASERRDRAEFGFAQLRLVICFLRWHNLKEVAEERIHSPLLLLPVELTRRKGVRDAYVLKPLTTEAEVNPALRHHLRQLYGLNLPEIVDLSATTLDAFHALLAEQIRASEPGVTLTKQDRPQIELIHERARQRLDQFRRRQRLTQRGARRFRVVRLQLRSRTIPSARGSAFSRSREAGALAFRRGDGQSAGATSAADRGPGADRRKAARVGEGAADLCRARAAGRRESVPVGLRSLQPDAGKFQLPEDVARAGLRGVVGTGAVESRVRVYFLTATAFARRRATRPPRPLSEQFPAVDCDPTQSRAVARARRGESYIIQGPPGTGKSQTITNLIADFVARGKRVLFVCEKRAAIDVVFHRLGRQGLDELCCLIHDSQTDKREFIRNLKQTYEAFLNQPIDDTDRNAPRGTGATDGTRNCRAAAMDRCARGQRGRLQPHGARPACAAGGFASASRRVGSALVRAGAAVRAVDAARRGRAGAFRRSETRGWRGFARPAFVSTSHASGRSTVRNRSPRSRAAVDESETLLLEDCRDHRYAGR